MTERRKPYRFLENIAIADLAFEAHGKTLPQLFQHAAEALFATMADLKTVKARVRKIVHEEHEQLEWLLYNFLDAFVFLKDTERIIFRTCTVSIDEGKKGYLLTAMCVGDHIDPKTQVLRDDVKAITWHLFELMKEKGGYRARVVIDL